MPKPESPVTAEPAPVIEQRIEDTQHGKLVEVRAETPQEHAAAIAEIRNRLEHPVHVTEGGTEELSAAETIQKYELGSKEGRFLEEITGAPYAHHIFSGDFNADFKNVIHAKEEHDKKVRKAALVGMAAAGTAILSVPTAVAIATGGSMLISVGATAVPVAVAGVGIWHGVKWIQQLNRRSLEARAKRLG